MRHTMKNALTLSLIAFLGLVHGFGCMRNHQRRGQRQAACEKSIKLEDDRYLVEVSRSNGSITRIRDKKGDIELIREPRLADNFRFTLPIPGKEPWQTIEANYIWGNQQKLSSVETDARKLTLHWSKPLVNYLGETFDASAAMGIELTGDGVLFRLRIHNATRYPIGEVFFPLIGGVQGIGKTGRAVEGNPACQA